MLGKFFKAIPKDLPRKKIVFFQYVEYCQVGYGVYKLRVQNQIDFIKFGGTYFIFLNYA